MNKKIILFIIVVILATAFILEYSGERNIDKINISESTDFYKIEATYPKDSWDKKGEMEQVVKYMVNQKKDEWKKGGDIYNEEQRIAKEFPDRPKMAYDLNISYISTSSDRFKTRTYIFYVYQFTGGAHGATAVTTYTFNKKGRIRINQILDFDNNKDISIVRLLAVNLKEILGDLSDEKTIDNGLGLSFLKKDGSLDKEKCNCDEFFFSSNMENFVIKDEGISFIMKQYQVAPYVVGMPEVALSWDDLRPYVLKENPIGI